MNYKKVLVSLPLLIAVFVTPMTASANTVFRTGDSVSVAQDQIVEGDFYSLSADASMSGVVTEDFYSISGSLTTNGTIGADLFAITGVAQIHASVTDDVRIIGGEVTIADHVQGDLVVVGGVLKVLSSATIDGDILFFGDRAEINAPVGGSVMGIYNSLRIDAEVKGDVDVTASALTIGELAVINGDVNLKSQNDLIRAQGSTIVGSVSHNALTDSNDRDLRSVLRSVLVPFLISLFAALSFYLLFRRHIELLGTSVFNRFGFTALIGACGILAGPFIAIILVSTVLAMYVGFVGLGIYIILLAIAFIVAQIALGALVFRLLGRQEGVTPITILSGVFLFHVVAVIPLVGQLFVFIMVAAATGTLMQLLYKHTR